MRIRVRFRFQHKEYPLSPELTKKSMRVGTLTHPIYGLILGMLPGLASAILFPSSVTVPMVLMLGGIIAGPILLSVYRKKKFAQYDAEYAQILRSIGK